MSERSSTVVYRECPGHPGYRVGSDGTVWSNRKRGARFKDPTKAECVDNWRKLTISIKANQRAWVALYDGSRRVDKMVHHLVLEAFVGPCPDGMECCHFPDPDPLNNQLANLQWGSKQENCHHRFLHGKHSRGSRNGMARLTEEEVRYLRANPDKLSICALARKLGVSKRAVQFIIRRKNWAWLP